MTEARGKRGDESPFEATACSEWAPVRVGTESGAQGTSEGPTAPFPSRSVSLSDYPSARSFFSAVRDASLEADRTLRTIQRMEAAEGVRAQGYEAQGRSGSVSDRMAATDARMEYEERMRKRVDEDYALIDLACQVLYGRESGKGGVDALMGSAVADCINLRYVDARPWGEVAAMMGYSPDSAKALRALCSQGFDCVDFLGWDNVTGGAGAAT